MIQAASTILATELIPSTISGHRFNNGPAYITGYADRMAHLLTDNTEIIFETLTTYLQRRTIATDWASAVVCFGMVLIGDYLYAFYLNSGTTQARVYRYDASNLAAGGTLMTISGQSFVGTGGLNVWMTSDGTHFYFTYKAGNSANSYVLSKYSLSGTTLTYVSDITCGTAVASNAFVVNTNGIYIFTDSDAKIRKYNTSGTIQYTTPAFSALQGGMFSLYGNPYLGFKESATAYAFLERVILT